MTEAAEIAGLLGGKRLLKVQVNQDRDLVEVVRAGIPASAIRAFAASTQTSIALLGAIAHIDARTLSRRLASNARLKPDESDRVLRVARVFALARAALRSDARAWLNSENRALGGVKPIELLDTDTGTRQVEQVIGRIEHGIFS
jgi:putative toxin-antitoxin system antitoxin component (TIGR02293 family)